VLTSGNVLENFSATYPLAMGLRLALLVVLTSCYPKVQHAVRDSAIRIATANAHSTDTVHSSSLAALTAAIVGASTAIGVVCDRVEVVLAYKGAILGSLLVYILPPLMYVALCCQQQQQHASRCASMDGPAPAHATPSLDNPGAVPLLGDQGADLQPRGAQHETPPPAVAPSRPGAVVVSMLTSHTHMGPALLFLWGVVSGVLGLAITIDKQLGADAR
jgi:hypothetical protein